MAPLANRLFDSPIAFASGCLVWIPVCIWVVSLVSWMVQGDVAFVWGFAGISIALFLGFVTMTPPRPELSPFLLVGMALTTVLFPFFRSSLNRRALEAVDVEAVEDAYEMLRLKPDNHLVRFKLAKLLHKRGMTPSAIAFGEQAMENVPAAAFQEEARALEMWRRSMIRAPAEEYLVCLECGFRNELGIFVCGNCGAEFLIDHIRGRWLGRNLARKLLSIWASVMLLLVGIPAATLLLSRTLAACAVVLLVVASAGLLAFAFVTSKSSSA